MATFVFILIILAIIGGVVWNHVSAGKAVEGVDLTLSASPDAVVQAIVSTYCVGGKAILRNTVGGVRVEKTGPSSFEYKTKYGDRGTIVIESSPNGTHVRAVTSKLFVGSTLKMRPKDPIYRFAFSGSRAFSKMVGIRPGAPKMKAFQDRLRKTLPQRVN